MGQNYLSKIVAAYSDTLTTDINENLFDRRLGKQIHEFIIDDLKSIETLPNIHLQDIEYITDPSKIDVRLNRKNIKNKKILRQKIEKLIPMNQTIFDALKFTIAITNGAKVENLILIPKYIDRYHFMIEGNKTLPMFQIVDNSTYNQKGNIILKTRISAKLSKEKKKFTLVDVNTNEEYAISTIFIDLFKKKFNPLYYYAAKKGILETIDYFDYTKYVNIVSEITKPDVFHYFKINANMYAEVEKYLFENDGFFKVFVGMLIDIFNARSKMEDIINQDFWVKKLGSLFTTSSKNQFNKGEDVLKSFKNVLDVTTQKTLRISDHDKYDIYSVIRWMMRDFNDLRNADNNNLDCCRIRTNEYIAAYFGLILKDRVNYALNMKPFDETKFCKVFKFDEYVLFKALFGGSKACPLFRHNIDINDLQALNGLKYSLTGIQGLPSNRIKDEQRDLYPSHLRRLDPNSISSSSPGTSGMLTPFCKIYENGYFGQLEEQGKSYEDKLKKRIKVLKENPDIYEMIGNHYDALKEYYKQLAWRLKYSIVRNEKGFIQITHQKHERWENGYIAIIPKIKYVPYTRNERGYIKIIRKNNNRLRIIRKPRPIKIIRKNQQGRYNK